MKKFKRTVVFILCAAFCAFACLSLIGCDKNNGADDKGYIVVSFDLQWDKGIPIEPIILDGKEEKVMPQDPARAGYTFVGWYFEKECKNKFEPGITPLTEDTTLYAKWMSNGFEAPDYPIIENPNGIIYKEMRSEDGSIYYVVTGYKGTEKDIVIPSRYNTHPVNEIADGAFSGNVKIETVTFGSGIDKVGKEAFRGCTALRSVTVGEKSGFFTSVDGALYDRNKTTLICFPSASAATKVTLGKELENICDYALENCAFELSIPDDGKYKAVDSYDFAGFKGKLNMGKNVTAIRQYAFRYATCEINFGAESNVGELFPGAFEGYSGEELIIPYSVKKLPLHAFNGCSAVVDLSKTGIKRLSENCFAGYMGKTLAIPSWVTEIEKNAFYKSATKISFNSGSEYKTVRAYSFNEFSGEVIFPFTVEKVEANAFYRAQAEVAFYGAQDGIDFDEGFDNEFRGKLIYGKN